MKSILCWTPTTPDHGAYPGVVDIPINTSVEKPEFPFPSHHQLQVAAWLGVELVSTFPSQLMFCPV